MDRIQRALILVLIAAAAAACGDTATTGSSGPTPTATAGTLAGKYNCLQPQSTQPDVVELKADGTSTITQPGGETFQGKWSAQGTSGAFNPGTPDEEKFTVQDGKIVFTDGTTCTRAAD